MRDPNRIDEVLGALREYWVAHPDMRLGQILVNLIGAKFAVDIFYVEDDVCWRDSKKRTERRVTNDENFQVDY